MATTETGSRSVNRRGIVILIIALVASLVVAGLAVGEVMLRNKIKDCVAGQFSSLGADVEVGLSAKPVLLQVLGGELDYVTLDTKEATTGSVQGLEISGRVDDLDTGTGATKSSEATVKWSSQGILSTLQQQSFGSFIQEVTTNSDNTIHVGFALGLAEATVQVTAANDKLELKALSSSFLGFGIPNDIVDNILATLNENLNSGDLPFGLKAKSVSMDSSGLTMHFEGANWTPSAASTTPTTGTSGTESTNDQAQSMTSC